MKIFYSSKFEKQLKKLHKDLQSLAFEKEDIFRQDPFDPRLKTHKLHGRFSNLLAFSINYKYRIMFKYMSNAIDVAFYEIGKHDIYE